MSTNVLMKISASFRDPQTGKVYGSLNGSYYLAEWNEQNHCYVAGKKETRDAVVKRLRKGG